VPDPALQQTSRDGGQKFFRLNELQLNRETVTQ
jgi:hypothetical protein